MYVHFDYFLELCAGRLISTARESTKGGNSDRCSCELVVINKNFPDISITNIYLQIPWSAPAAITDRPNKKNVFEIVATIDRLINAMADSVLLLIKVSLLISSIHCNPITNICLWSRGDVKGRFKSMVRKSYHQLEYQSRSLIGQHDKRYYFYYNFFDTNVNYNNNH